ncbi:hypothetical protein AB1Y20_014347 [Prymnesium parvum]|uniref:Prolyl 4-hydroxylase alpha subunit domain-containing protein n=1 Tax=Prymnesium parvum TaxID=97485 RepID=A0AB34IEQ8_PRYPA
MEQKQPYGGRREGGQLWLYAPRLAFALLPPRREAWQGGTAAGGGGGGRREALPPLRALQRRVGAAALRELVARGYAVVDGALPAALCEKLRREMEALEAAGQLWNSHSYAGERGAAHRHIHETQLDYKDVRKIAPTFNRIEKDSTLIDLLRGVPGLANIGGQHVRIQINSGHGGCYTLHTDAGTAEVGSGQTLLVTALVYLNRDWKEGDGGELRVFPYPFAPRKIPPLEGRMVLFEPRMVHDVMPNFKKRFCFTLWCNAKGLAASQQIDHDTLQRMTLTCDVEAAAAIAAEWRERSGVPLPYTPSLPPPLRAFFLPEMRGWLVRYFARHAEIEAVSRSHSGAAREEMVEGISAHHQTIHDVNPRWLTDLVEQLPGAPPLPSADAPAADEQVAGGANGSEAPHKGSLAEGDEVVTLSDLQLLIHERCEWWI